VPEAVAWRFDAASAQSSMGPSPNPRRASEVYFSSIARPRSRRSRSQMSALRPSGQRSRCAKSAFVLTTATDHPIKKFALTSIRGIFVRRDSGAGSTLEKSSGDKMKEIHHAFHDADDSQGLREGVPWHHARPQGGRGDDEVQ